MNPRGLSGTGVMPWSSDEGRGDSGDSPLIQTQRVSAGASTELGVGPAQEQMQTINNVSSEEDSKGQGDIDLWAGFDESVIDDLFASTSDVYVKFESLRNDFIDFNKGSLSPPTPMVLHHQLYALIANRTYVDLEVALYVKRGLWRTFRSAIYGGDQRAIVKVNDLAQRLAHDEALRVQLLVSALSGSSASPSESAPSVLASSVAMSADDELIKAREIKFTRRTLVVFVYLAYVLPSLPVHADTVAPLAMLTFINRGIQLWFEAWKRWPRVSAGDEVRRTLSSGSVGSSNSNNDFTLDHVNRLKRRMEFVSENWPEGYMNSIKREASEYFMAVDQLEGLLHNYKHFKAALRAASTTKDNIFASVTPEQCIDDLTTADLIQSLSEASYTTAFGGRVDVDMMYISSLARPWRDRDRARGLSEEMHRKLTDHAVDLARTYSGSSETVHTTTPANTLRTLNLGNAFLLRVPGLNQLWLDVGNGREELMTLLTRCSFAKLANAKTRLEARHLLTSHRGEPGDMFGQRSASGWTLEKLLLVAGTNSKMSGKMQFSRQSLIFHLLDAIGNGLIEVEETPIGRFLHFPRDQVNLYGAKSLRAHSFGGASDRSKADDTKRVRLVSASVLHAVQVAESAAAERALVRADGAFTPPSLHTQRLIESVKGTTRSTMSVPVEETKSSTRPINTSASTPIAAPLATQIPSNDTRTRTSNPKGSTKSKAAPSLAQLVRKAERKK